ncbi:MAG: fibronectin type III domain-containing protein [Lachnospiraceae bacterium]|nr:fibronectin type III domain-containing protein [Lachnospiraceae bacterium]
MENDRKLTRTWGGLVLTLALALICALAAATTVHAEEAQGGSNMASAYTISAGTSYSDSITDPLPSTGADYFKFELSSSGRVSFTIIALMQRAHIYLLDSSGEQMYNSGALSWDSSAGQITNTFDRDLTKGIYYLVVEPYNYTGTYTFSYSFTSAGESFTETGNGTNNSLAAASTISVGTTYTGQLATNDSNDVYKFTISSDGYYDLYSVAYFWKLHYNLYDSIGTKIWSKPGIEWDTSIGCSVVNEPIYLEAGIYYFAASYYNEVTTGIFNFKVSQHTHSYTTNITAATTSANGTIKKICSGCGYTKTSTIYKIKTVKLSTTTYTYNGKARKPTVTVKDSKGNTISSSYYTVKYASGRKKVGTYKVTITFKGNYSGTVTKTFTIKPKATSISKLTAKSKGFKVTWSKVTTQTSGYQIQYATNKSFTSNKKTVTVSGSSKKTYTLSKLKASKKYYVRVRTYKTVSGTRYYSSWSSAKTVTTKK